MTQSINNKLRVSESVSTGALVAEQIHQRHTFIDC